MKTVVVLNKNQMGQGDPALGQKILATFLRKSTALRDLKAIVFFNEGVRLTAVGSPVLGELQQLQDAGVDLLPCGTCLDFYGLTSALGPAAGMDDILRELDTATKVITL